MTSKIAALALGSAQFGLDYGVSNRRGRVPFAEVEQILARAAAAGVTMIDTAPAYGDCEEILGAIIADEARWRIVTKTEDLSKVALGKAASHLSDGFLRSLDRLRRSQIDTLLFHRPQDLMREDGAQILDATMELRRAGLVRRLGVSVYDAADLDAVLALAPWDVVQVPLSVVDQRLIFSGHLRRLAAGGVEVHARSAFLQGLLLCPANELPGFVSPFAAALGHVGERARSLGLSPLEFCLAFVRRVPEVSVCFIGLTGIDELEQALAAALPELPDLSELAVTDPDLVDPRLWPRR